MSSLVNIVPPTAVLAESGEVVNVDQVKLNSILAVKAGETIPIDGIVVVGECDVDEKTLTGESFPVTKQKDSRVWAGTTNLNSKIVVLLTSFLSSGTSSNFLLIEFAPLFRLYQC